MNYIEQINCFWDKVQTENNLKTSSIAIYMALLQINNKCGWIDEFTVDYDRVLKMAGLTKNTYYAGVKELVLGDYVIYKPGPNQYMAATFKLKVLYQNLGTHQVKQRERIRSSKGNASGQAKGILDKQVNYETIKHSNNEEVVEVNARAAEIENAITDFCEGNNENSEKEKNSAQKEKKLPQMAEAMEKVAGMAVWRNCVEHHGITEDDRPKLFKIFYEQKEDAYKIRYPSVSDMANNFYYWISVVKKLNKLNDLLNGNEQTNTPIYVTANTYKSRTANNDKRAGLLKLAEQSEEFLRSTAG